MNDTAVTLPELAGLDPRSSTFAVDVVDRLLPLAIERGASDIHVQPTSGGWEILLRIDGVLSVVDRLAGGGSSDPVSRLMVLASLPTYRSGQPMEGRLQFKTADSSISMRLGVFPSLHGPRAVVRMLRRDATHESIESLAMDGDTSRQLEDLCQETDGLILLSGPAGSGKTTTMYAMLRRIAAQVPRRSVLTVEDPIEVVIEGISQSELDPSLGMTLASALRSAVRQDSEVLLISEIRDPETAEAALQASLTGHLIFSSLHATDIAASLRRLVQLGVPPYVVRSGVRAIVSQRLLRRCCPECDSTSRKGCKNCLGTGYRGRLAISACVRFDDHDAIGEAMGDALEAAGTTVALRKAAEDAGATTLREQAYKYIRQGHTDEAEVYRVLGTA